MSMPFRFAVSEKPATILPFAGHAQSSLSSSPAPADGAAGVTGAGVAGLGGRTSGLGSTRTPPGAAIASASGGAGTALAASVRSRTAWSVYGSLMALGDVLTLLPAVAVAD